MPTAVPLALGTGAFSGSESDFPLRKTKNYPQKFNLFHPLLWLAVFSRSIVNISKVFFTTIQDSKSGEGKILKFLINYGCAEAACFLYLVLEWATFIVLRDGPEIPRPSMSRQIRLCEIIAELLKLGGTIIKNISTSHGQSQKLLTTAI